MVVLVTDEKVIFEHGNILDFGETGMFDESTNSLSFTIQYHTIKMLIKIELRKIFVGVKNLMTTPTTIV